jgi:murein DD-endopeptidase MepM/ murein hydrolase activator NlpD
VKRFIPVFLIATILLSSCGQTPSLWGTYSTPTSDSFFPTLFVPEPQPATASPTLTPRPTSTYTLTPTLIPLQSSTALTPFNGTPALEGTLTPTFDVPATLYYSQSGDDLKGLAKRFNVDPSEIRSDSSLPQIGLIAPGTLLVIPDRITEKTTPNIQILPDSEVVFSATALDFDIAGYIKNSGGILSHYREYLGSTGWTTGPEEIRRLAYENSINPRLLLALLDYEGRWVHGQPVDILHTDYPMGFQSVLYKGMFSQMVWAVNQLSIGYYGWRAGTITELDFPDGTKLRLDPHLNAGTVAIQYLFSQLHSQSQWSQMLNLNSGFPAMYTQLFGDPWARADTVEPIFPPGLSQPDLSLPFQPNVEWSFTGGPHGAWEHDGSLAAVDFAPATDHGGCDLTPTWVTAAAPGLIVRSENGVVMEDLDGDGYEQTGWDLLYLHVATVDRVPVGTYVQKNDHIGHASCEGGIATGTHLHFVRKYNGEWVAADGPIPFVIDGWTVHQGALPYEGTLTRDNKKIIADPVGQLKSVIIRASNDQ